MEKLDHNKVIARAALKLIKAHRESDQKDMLYTSALDRADYILEDLQDEVVDLVYALLDADNFGALINSLPVTDKSEVKAYYNNLDAAIQNLPAAIYNSELDEHYRKLVEYYNNLYATGK